MHSRRQVRFRGVMIIAGLTSLSAPPAPAQTRPPDYPERPPAPAEQVARGQQIFRSGIPAQGMPKFALSAADITDIAAWLHSQPLSDRGAPSTLDILVGNARQGASYFNGAGHCTQCHSATGDLAGIGSRYEPKTIQNLIVSGGGGRGRRRSGAAAPPVKAPPTTVTVTLPSGQRVQGDLDHLSAFVVALRDSNGAYHSFARHDSIPKVVVTNPLQWHIDRLPQWRDADIHNLTAYLVMLK